MSRDERRSIEARGAEEEAAASDESEKTDSRETSFVFEAECLCVCVSESTQSACVRVSSSLKRQRVLCCGHRMRVLEERSYFD